MLQYFGLACFTDYFSIDITLPWIILSYDCCRGLGFYDYGTSSQPSYTTFLRMRSLQLWLHHLWDLNDDFLLIPWDLACRQDLQWWLVLDHLLLGISLTQVHPHLYFCSDASDVGWGAHLLGNAASVLWSLEEAILSINARELLAVEKGLLQFVHLLSNSTVALFSDNSTALAYLRKPRGTWSTILILCWPETIDLVLAPQFIQGKHKVLADSLSRPNQIQGSDGLWSWRCSTS